jgi:hypothetical protein
VRGNAVVTSDRLYRLVRDLVAVHPHRPSGHLTCTYCGVTMFGTAEALAALRHRSGCPYQHALAFLAVYEASAEMRAAAQ